MPNDFSASVIEIVRAKMDTIFASKATLNPELNKRPVTQMALLTKQTANVEPVMDASGNLCVGLRAWYYTADVTAKPTDSATPIAGTCDLTTGDGVSTASQDFALNYFQKPSISINDKDCDNYSKFTDRLAFLLPQKMSLMVQKFNDHTINQLEANKSVAVLPVPDDVTIGVGGDYTITGADFWKGAGAADTLAILDLLADMKGLPNNYYIISGRALRVPYDLAQSKRVNDNERSYSLMFSQREMFNDVDNLDAIITAEVVYLVDPNIVLSYFYSEYPAEGRNVGDDKNTVEFSLPLQYYDMYQDGNEQLVTLQYANNGMLQDARIDVRYQKNCDVVNNKFGKPSTTHVWELDLCALFEFITATDPNQTGVIRVDKAL
jgi:hypothetical protein